MGRGSGFLAYTEKVAGFDLCLAHQINQGFKQFSPR